MLKKLSLLLVLLFPFFMNAQDVTATVKVPANASPGNDITIEITINKGEVNGFMKYFQPIPEGYSTNEVDSKTGSFTFADNGAKIIWISPPAAPQFVVVYKITVPSNATGSFPVGGKLSYVVGNERKTFEIPAQTVTIGGGVAVNTPPKTDPVKTEPVKAEPAKTEPVKETPVVKETKPAESADTKTSSDKEKPKPVEPAPVKKDPTPVVVKETKKAPVTAVETSGKTYRVQIGAFNLKPSLEGVPQLTTVVLDNGMTKCFSGNFSTYEEAVKRKNEMIAKGFEGAFVVSFENGKIVK